MKRVKRFVEDVEAKILVSRPYKSESLHGAESLQGPNSDAGQILLQLSNPPTGGQKSINI